MAVAAFLTAAEARDSVLEFKGMIDHDVCQAYDVYGTLAGTDTVAAKVGRSLESWTWSTQGELSGASPQTFTLQCRDSNGTVLTSNNPGGGVRRVRVVVTGGITMTDGGAGSVVSGSGTGETVFDTDATGAVAITFTTAATDQQLRLFTESEHGPLPLADHLASKIITLT